MKGKKRMAVLVGCNYPNTQNELHGCINDVLAMKEVLVNRSGLDPSHVQLLTDEPGSVVLPTGANIKRELGRMIDQAEAGDVLFFHYSGHGTTIPSNKPGHAFRQDEAIVPRDFNLIADLDFRQLVNRLAKGASLTNNTTVISHNPKAIAYESILQHLTSLTNIKTSDVGTHLFEFFGSDASLKYRLPPWTLICPFPCVNLLP